MGWTVVDTSVPASKLKALLAGLGAQGLEAQVHLAGPLMRNPQTGQAMFEATYLVLARPSVAQEPSEPGNGSEAAAPTPDPLEALPEALREKLAAGDISTAEALAAGWPDRVAQLQNISMADCMALDRFLREVYGGAAQEYQAPPIRESGPELAPAIGPIPRNDARNPGVVLVPGMENCAIVPRGGNRPHIELPPHLQAATILDGNPNVKHMDAEVIRKRPADYERDGISEPGAPV